MEPKVKAIKLRVTYEGDFSRLQNDVSSLKSIRRQLEKYPLRVPIALDVSNIKSQAAKAAREYGNAFQSEMAKVRMAQSGGAMSAGGIAIPPGAMRDLEKFGKTSGKVFQSIHDDAGKAISSLEQLERGLVKMNRRTKDKNGKEVTKSTYTDTRPVENLKNAMEQIDRDFATSIAAAKANKSGIGKALEEKRAKMDEEIKKHTEALEWHPAWIAAKKAESNLLRQVAEANAKEATAAGKERIASRADKLRQNLDRLDRGYAKPIGNAAGTKADLAALLEQKRDRIQKELGKFADVAHSPAYRAAQKAISGMNQKIAQISPQQIAAAEKATRAQASAGASRTVTDVDRARGSRERGIAGEINTARHIRDEATRTAELNRHLDAREKLIDRTAKAYERLEQRARAAGNADAADKFKTAGLRTRKDLGVVQGERNRDNLRQGTETEDRKLNQRITEAKRYHAAQQDILNTQEANAMATKNRSQREAELNRILAARRELGKKTANKLTDVHADATAAGKHSIADSAAQANLPVMSKLEAANRKAGAAARKSGHDIDFHSSSLLKNAATFTKWFIPAQAVMGVFSAMAAGARNAVSAQRTFKTLNAVFQGSREESEMLARQTLQLAAANGRSADEAAEAAVSWARLGLTRSQVLMAMETSLRAANVAEISTADATKYLTAQYKAFNQSLTDIPGNLDYINSLSNKLNVTPESIMQGIARTATVAKQAGVELRELAAIVAVVSDVTGRPGEETGNAMKFILTRIRRPQTLDSIKDEFDLDLRKPNGDAKDMTEIFGDLAALYPKLNKLEKARINDLVAGSRQTERYAVIVDNWTEILTAQAEAAADANSAQRENSEILSSTAAKIEQVNTAWTGFIHALGESAGFDMAANFLKGLSEDLDEYKEAIDRYNGANPKGESRTDFDALSRKDKSILNATADKTAAGWPTEEKLKKRISSSKENTKAAIEGGADSPEFAAIRERYSELHSGKKITFKELEDYHSSFVMDKGTVTADKASKVALKYGESKGEIETLEKLSKAMQALAGQVLEPGVETNKTLKLFDRQAELLKYLPGGGGMKNVADAQLKIRPLIMGGKREEASAALMGLSKEANAGAADKRILAEEERKGALAAMTEDAEGLRKKIEELYQDMAKPLSEAAQEAYQKQIAKTREELKELEEAQKAVSLGMSPAKYKDNMETITAEIDEHVKDLTMAQETIGQAIEGFANTGFPDIDKKLRIGATFLKRDSLADSLERTKMDNAAYATRNQPSIDAFNTFGTDGMEEKDASSYTGYIDNIRQELAFRDARESKLRTELTVEEELTKYAERKLELQRQADTLSNARSDSEASTMAHLGAYGIGATEGERITNRTVGALGMARGIAGDPATGAGDALSDARELGSLTAALTDAKAGILSMEQRMHAAVAERANLEIEITEQAMKQREEASKRLALASREDQLRAAAASAVLRNRGSDGFSMQEFQFFGQETKGALSNLMPEKVKGLDDTERDNNRSRATLDREVAGIAASIGGLNDTFEEVRRMAAERAGDLANGMRPEAVDGNRVADRSKGEARVNLNLGDVVMNFDLAPHMARMQAALQGRIDEKMNQIIEQFKRPFIGSPAPNTAPAASAF